MGTIVGFATLKPARGNLRLSRAGQVGFTPRDRADLMDWAGPSRRVCVHTSDTGIFAMLYVDGQPWASWGLERQGRRILLWNCVTHADVDRFDHMADALAAIGDDAIGLIENILPFAAARAGVERELR